MRCCDQNGASVQGFVTLLALLALGYVALCALMYFTQRSQIYFPTPPVAAVPGAILIPQLRATDGTPLKVWVLGGGRDDAGAPVLLYFGGNGEDVTANASAFASAFPRHAIHLIHYRGYGGAPGSPSEAALVADAIMIHDAVRRARPNASIDVLGRSLGSGVAVRLAAERPTLRSLILVTPFDSLVAVARHHFPWLPAQLLLRERYDSAALVKAGRVHSRTLVVVADEDEIVPATRAEALIEALRDAQLQLVVERLPGATHNTIDFQPRYLGSIAEFLGYRAELAPPGRRP